MGVEGQKAWCGRTLIIPECRRQREEGHCELEDGLCYMVRLSQNKQKERKILVGVREGKLMRWYRGCLLGGGA